VSGSEFGAELAPLPGESGAGAKASRGTSVGLSPKVAGLLCYLIGWITGIVFLVIEKKSRFVRFHAWQSIITFATLSVAQIIVPTILGAIAVATSSGGLYIFTGVFVTVVWLLMAVLWVILMVQAGIGKKWKLPWVGNWAERQAGKFS